MLYLTCSQTQHVPLCHVDGIKKQGKVLLLLEFLISGLGKIKGLVKQKKDNVISNDLISFDPPRELHRLVRDEEKEQLIP